MKWLNAKIPIAILTAVLISSGISAQEFSGENVKALIDTLCGPEFTGRKSGDPEAHLAELWAAEKLAQYGLKPGAGDTYLQTFPILCNRELKASLKLLNGVHGSKKYLQGEDFHLNTNSGSANITAQVVFLGYGIYEPEKNWDDFQGLDLKGKIALIVPDIPGSEREWSAQRWRDYKVKKAVEHGAVAVLFCDREFSISGAAIHQEAFNPRLPILMLSENVGEDLFRGTGRRWENTLDDLKSAPASFNTGKIMKIKTELKYQAQATAANVIGFLPGQDPLLKDEWIVIGGHLDHNGVNAVGDIFPGADDNASGAAIVMELGRYLAQKPIPLKRSLAIILFAAEEQGLLGSKYFTDNPSIPLDKISAMFNFDCCGLGEGKAGMGGFEFFPQIWQEYKKGLSDEDLEQLEVSRSWSYGSDNHSFRTKGIPTFNCWSSASRPFYHHLEDTPEKISLSAVTAVGKSSLGFIEFIADWSQPLISEYYAQRTLLFSAYSVNLICLNKPESIQDPDLLAKSRSLHNKGVKWALVGISATDPYAQFDLWQNFCDSNEFMMVSSAEGIKNAFRKQKFAFLPVITDFDQLDENGSELRNLFNLGVKSVWLNKELKVDDRSRYLLEEISKLGMVCFIEPEASILDSIPENTRLVKFIPEDETIPIPSAEDLINIRLLVNCPNPALSPDSADVLSHAVILNIPWDNEDQPLNSLKIVAELQQAGFTNEQIRYMLGENLLNILP